VNEIIPFQYQDREVRTVTVDGEPWFVAADVCAILDIANVGNALNRLDGDDIRQADVIDTIGRRQSTKVISEAGLYELVIRSDKPEAKPFRRWVTSEVLPAIRRTGSYGVPAQRVEVSPRELALMVIAEADRADAAEAKVAELAPAATSWTTLASGIGDYSVADAAKILSRDPAITLGRDRLFTVLRQLGWCYRQAADGRHRCYQAPIECGRLSEIPTSHYHPRTGELVLDPPQVRVTVKGLEWLHHHLADATGRVELEGGVA
jgi:anti-repressor protein